MTKAADRPTGGTTEVALDRVAGGGGRPAGSPLEVFGVFLKLGVSSFGGPIAHIGYFREEFVVRRRWLGEQAFVDLVALCQFLPGPASQPGRILDRPDARRLCRRAGRVGGLHAAVGHSAGAFRLWRGRPVRLDRHGTAARSQARRRRDRRAGGMGHGAHAVSGSRARIDGDLERAHHPVQRLVGRPGRRDCARRHRSACGFAAARRQRRTGTSLCRCRAASGSSRSRRFSFCSLACPSRRSSEPRRASRSSTPSIARARWCSAAAMWCCRCCARRSWRPAGSATMRSSPATARPRRCRARSSPSRPIWARSSGRRRTASPGAALGLFGIFLPGILILLGALPFWDSLRKRVAAQAAMRGVNAAVVGLLGAALYNPLWTSSVKTPGDFGARARRLRSAHGLARTAAPGRCRERAGRNGTCARRVVRRDGRRKSCSAPSAGCHARRFSSLCPVCSRISPPRCSIRSCPCS